MDTDPRIAILLSTYNGAGYLAEQLDSIFAQSYENFVLLVRDDGSSDGTNTILQDYADRYERMRLLPASGRNRGASQSFSWLIDYALENKQALGLAPAYLMFADQDDVWLPEKVQILVDALLRAQRDVGAELPVLVHSDLQVVSADLEILADSLISFQGLDATRNRLTNMLMSNVVTGCTCLINEAVARRALPIPDQAVMHDWWLALVASAFGKVVFVPEALVRYRQHDSNTIGAREFTRSNLIDDAFWRKLLRRRPNEHFAEVAVQARAFRDRHGKQLGLRERFGLALSARMDSRSGLLQRIIYRLARRI